MVDFSRKRKLSTDERDIESTDINDNNETKRPQIFPFLAANNGQPLPFPAVSLAQAKKSYTFLKLNIMFFLNLSFSITTMCLFLRPKKISRYGSILFVDLRCWKRKFEIRYSTFFY